MKKMHAPFVIAGPAVESTRRSCGRSQGFTLIELLVVISIIALLVGILLPTLGRAREEANTIKCAASARSIGQAVANYCAGNKDYYPTSYAYINKGQTNWSVADQQGGKPSGMIYYHWSYALVGGSTGSASFTCPSMNNGGLPRTNPGTKGHNWESGQTDDGGASVPNNAYEDAQVERTAYAMNGLVVPRNKFVAGSSARLNVFVKAGMIRAGSKTILAAELLNNYKAFMNSESRVLSHRPIAAVKSSTADYNYLEMPLNSMGNANYEAYKTMLDDDEIQPYSSMIGLTSGGPLAASTTGGGPNINAVARHHRGGKQATSTAGNGAGNEGSGNILFVDGHVTRMTVRKTIEDKLWGDQIYCVNGAVNKLN